MVDVRELRETKTDVDNAKVAKIETEIAQALQRIMIPLVEVGAAGRLLLAGELDRVLPLEDAAAMRAANPVMKGMIAFDGAKVQARQAAMVKNVSDRGNVGIIVLGDSHDLTRLLPEGTEYIRVTVKAMP